ncbi:MAG: efflux RND transporter permease subunit, partial [Bacteroidales bacterium]|nr:efflux RND transporter permease subunit [Bacteroidales bacterium]
SIYKEPKFNTVQAVEELNKTFVELSKALPGYRFIPVTDQGEFIDSAISEVMNTALIGILLAVFVLFIFLRRIGTTLVVSIAIPVSIIATFNLMYFNGLTINIMTLGGLALGAGMLVDNAIVVLENIFRNHEAGMSWREASITGTAEVGGAITASTITTIVVFLPIVYMHGASGELFRDQAWTVAFSLLSSLFVALLVIPLMIAKFFRENKSRKSSSSAVTIKWYPALLGKIIKGRAVIVLLALLLLTATWFLIPRVGSEFMPGAGSETFTVELELPKGTGLERTASTTEKAAGIIRSLLGEKIEMLYTHAGTKTTTGGSGDDLFRNENNSSITVILKKEFARQSDEAAALIEKNLSTIPDIEITFAAEESALQTALGTGVQPFVVEISGEDPEILAGLMDQVREKLNSVPSLYNITTSLDKGTPEVNVEVDRFRASFMGIPVTTIISQIESYLSGAEAGEFEYEGEIKDITVKLDEVPLSSLQNLIITSGDTRVPLSDLADVKVIDAPGEITRNNQKRTVYLYAMTQEDVPLDRIVKEAQKVMGEVAFAPDYKAEITGEELKRKESMSSLTFALILSIVLVYMVLASQFESLIHPFVILLTIPLAAVGSVWIFYLVGKPLNMMAYIGIIMLAGIAVNNSIILIDRINQIRSEGFSRYDSIIAAGAQRIRPIIMTSLTTILALLPLTIGFGESASLRSPMALAVIGGLVTSTLLTLVVIPSVYWILDSVTDWFKREKQEI